MGTACSCRLLSLPAGLVLRLLLLFAIVCCSSAQAQLMVFPSPFSSAGLPVTTTASTLSMPGEFRETRIASESALKLRPGLLWETSTGFTGLRYEQATLLREQSARVTTGPHLKWGA